MKKETRKKIIRHIFSALFFIMIIYFVFHDHYQDILLSISKLSLIDLIILALISIGYILLDSFSYYVMVHPQFPHFRFQNAIEVTLLGIFANVSTSTAGTLPMQSYYLYKQKMNIGVSISFMIFESVFHKISVFIYALISFLCYRKWLLQTIPHTIQLIDIGFLIYAIIIIFLILLCTGKKIQQFFLHLIKKLPDDERWLVRKQKLQQYIQSLYDESHKVVKDYRCCGRIMMVNFVKTGIILSVPYITMSMLKIPGPSFLHVQALSSFIFLIVGVLPNIAGVGPTELAFLLLFSPVIGQVQATSILILFRLVDYFLPFIFSMFNFIKLKNRFINKHNKSF